MSHIAVVYHSGYGHTKRMAALLQQAQAQHWLQLMPKVICRIAIGKY